MNYWLLTTEYPPFHGGGISTYCGFTAKMLAEAGCNVTVLIPDDKVSGYEEEMQDKNLMLIKFNISRINLDAFLGYTARLSYAFADIVKTISEIKGKPDVIEAQDYLGIAYYLLQFKHTGYSFIKNIPVIITLHSPAFIYLEYNKVPTYRFPDFWTCEMEKQSIKAADLLISPTVYLADLIGEYMDISDKKLHILVNPFTIAGAYFKNLCSRNKIVYYGKLSPQKGSFELLSYFKELWDTGFEYVLDIVGGTDIVFYPEMRTMGQIAQRMYGDYMTRGLLVMHGKIRPEQMTYYLQDAHVILVPSIVDNQPYVIMEAMSMGKVVLASIQGGQREMITDGVTGFLFDHDKPGSFKEKLFQVLALSNDKIQQIGLSAREYVKVTYSPVTVVEKKINLLQELIVTPANNFRFPFLHQEFNQPLLKSIPKNGLLSVVIPFYNLGNYIEDCLHSVYSCSYLPVEIIIVNDGSTDQESLLRLNKLVKKTNLRIVHTKNNGLAEARNYGAQIANGEYLAFLDADDKVSPLYYSKAIDVLAFYENVFFVGAWVQYFGNNKQIWPTFTPQPPYVLAHNPVNSSGLVYKRAAFLAAGLNDKSVSYGLEDYESVISLLHAGFNGVVLPEVLFFYRVRSGSMFRNISVNKLLYSNKYIAEKHSEYYAKFAVQLVNILNANGPGFLFDNPTLGITVHSQMQRETKIVRKIKSVIKSNEKVKGIVLSIMKYFKR